MDISYGLQRDLHSLRRPLLNFSGSANPSPAGIFGAVPQKKLAKADLAAQERWLNTQLPKIEESVRASGGVLLYEDEAVFQQSGTLAQTWARVGIGAVVKSAPVRRSAKVFGALNVTQAGRPKWHYRFDEVFNAETYLRFLKQLARYYRGQKIFLVADNVRYHHAKLVKDWVSLNSESIELHYLPAYSPEFNPVEPVWKDTKQRSTHNRYFAELVELYETLARRFLRYQGNPRSLRGIAHPFAVC